MHVKAQVILQGASALPEDRFVNVWHFDHDSPSVETAGSSIMPALDNFYGATIKTHPTAPGMSSWFSQYVLRSYEVRLYDMAAAEPRIPTIYARTLGSYPGTTGMSDLPEEVAVCLSYHAAPPVTDRRRGRIYLGPLNKSMCTDATTSQPMRISAAAMSSLAQHASNLVDMNVGWSIYSPTDDLLHLIEGGWVDNGLDTQRRRGPKTNARVLFPAP